MSSGKPTIFKKSGETSLRTDPTTYRVVPPIFTEARPLYLSRHWRGVLHGRDWHEFCDLRRRAALNNKLKTHIMKKFVLLTAAIALSFIGANTAQAAFSRTNAIPVQLSMTAVSVITNTSVTNAIGTVTSAAKTVTNVLTTKDLIKMIATEFNTNFPAGAVLAFNLTSFKFEVTDANGNTLLNASSNPDDSGYSLAISNDLVAAESGQMFTGKFVQATNGNFNANYNILASDYGLFYKDGHGNNFHILGVLNYKLALSQVGSVAKTTSFSLSLNGPGGGIFVQPRTSAIVPVVFTRGVLTGTGRNLIPIL